MNELKEIVCRYDMVCDNPSGVGMELYRMPEFFQQLKGMETDTMHLHGFYEIIWFQKGVELITWILISTQSHQELLFSFPRDRFIPSIQSMTKRDMC